MGGDRYKNVKEMNKKTRSVFKTEYSDPKLADIRDKELADKLRDAINNLNCVLTECDNRFIQVDITCEKNNGYFQDEYSAVIYKKEIL